MICHTRPTDHHSPVIICYLRYTIDPHKNAAFEEYARKWIPLVNKFGGNHLGYFLPHEGPNNIAIALFSFANLAAYEEYRVKCATDPDCCEAYAFEQINRSIISYERSFLKPLR
jgi:hypothetical protein